MRSLALGTIVKRKSDGRVGFIHEASFTDSGIDYGFVGLKKYGTRGFGSAWHSIEEFSIVKKPTKADWDYILEEIEFLSEHPGGEEDEEE